MSTQNLSNKTLRGYISSRNINGSFYPQNLQNLLIRSFSTENNINLQLSGTEWNIDNSYVMLRSIINKNNDGLIFFSIFQIYDSRIPLSNFVNKLLLKKKLIVFCLENLVITNKNDLKLVLDALKIYKINNSKNYKLNLNNLKKISKVLK
tara:strand:- start:28 stop:477 length:450 start_codon:yes stop_codon:yes gene_type:complete